MKIIFVVIESWVIVSLHNFAHVMTAQLSWHVQRFVVINTLQFGLKQNDISVKFELRVKSTYWNGPYLVLWSDFLYVVIQHLGPGPCL